MMFPAIDNPASCEICAVIRFLHAKNMNAEEIYREVSEFTAKSRSRDSVAGIATGWTIEGSEFDSRWGQEFSFLHVVQTCPEVHPTSYQTGTGSFFSGGKAAGCEADQSPPVSAEVNKMCIYTFTPTYAFMA
jgi:hypothetical protein